MIMVRVPFLGERTKLFVNFIHLPALGHKTER